MIPRALWRSICLSTCPSSSIWQPRPLGRSTRSSPLTAQTLGASRFQAFRYITLPLCRPALISAALLVWSRGIGEFGATLMLVGSHPPEDRDSARQYLSQYLHRRQRHGSGGGAAAAPALPGGPGRKPPGGAAGRRFIMTTAQIYAAPARRPHRRPGGGGTGRCGDCQRPGPHPGGGHRRPRPHRLPPFSPGKRSC